MSAIAETAVRERAARRQPAGRSRAARRTLSTPGAFTGGMLWIVAIAALLAGVVAINVLALRLNVQLDELRRTRADLKAEIATTRAQLSTASANERIVHEAVSRLGLVEHDPSQTTNLELDAP